MKKIVFIISMHRSGSSLLTKGLECLGVELGEKLMLAAGDNPKGFFEDQDVVNLNEELLCELDHQWTLISNNVRSLSDERLLYYKKKGKAILKDRISRCEGVFAIKDPRFCRLASFWFELCSALSIDYKIIFLSREPIDVSKSLNKRNNIPEKGAYALWVDYTLSALIQLRDHASNVLPLFICLPHFIRDIKSHVVEIGKYLNLDVDNEKLLTYEKDFFEQNLLHKEDTKLIDSDLWHNLHTITKAEIISIETLEQLIKTAELERKNITVLEGTIEQIEWYRKAESEAFRKHIEELQSKLSKINELSR